MALQDIGKYKMSRSIDPKGLSEIITSIVDLTGDIMGFCVQKNIIGTLKVEVIEPLRRLRDVENLRSRIALKDSKVYNDFQQVKEVLDTLMRDIVLGYANGKIEFDELQQWSNSCADIRVLGFGKPELPTLARLRLVLKKADLDEEDFLGVFDHYAAQYKGSIAGKLRGSTHGIN